ncbi:MAG TPA: DUF3048 domain-containing protein [Clostridia bacterium]|nr:DUF3048 domain-containing protein [Clostridia bacterium]
MHTKSIRNLVLWTLIVLMISASYALAVPITGGSSQRQSSGGAYDDNEVPYGKSPTTGLDFTGIYQPVMVQISNATGARPHWNLSEADIVYEAIIWGPGHTRYTAVYNDSHPAFVGPIRSIRLHNAQLRQEWDCPLVFWGGQSMAGTSVKEFFKTQNVPESILFDGTGGFGKAVADITARSSGQYARIAPHNAYGNLEALLSEYYPADYTSRNHAFQFTDIPAMGFDSAAEIAISYGNDYNPSYTYNAAAQVYERSYNGEPEYDGYTNERIVASNVIVQRTKHTYYNGIASRPLIETTGEGEAEIFIGGRHIRGKWMRKNLNDRTVFVDATGVEIQLLPGKTFIQIISNTLDFTYTRDDGAKITVSYDKAISDMEAIELTDTDAAELDKVE